MYQGQQVDELPAAQLPQATSLTPAFMDLPLRMQTYGTDLPVLDRTALQALLTQGDASCRKIIQRRLLKLIIIFPSASGQRQVVLSGRFHLNAGETFSLIGESGCGKSTILRVIAGLQREWLGGVQLLSQHIHRPALSRGFAPQYCRWSFRIAQCVSASVPYYSPGAFRTITHSPRK